MENHTPISFLGISDRYSEHFYANAITPTQEIFPVVKKNILGLREIYITSIFPFPASELFLLFLLDKELLKSNEAFNGGGIEILVEGPNETNVGSIKMAGSFVGSGKLNQRFLLQAAQPAGTFLEPGEYSLFVCDDKGTKESIGSFTMTYSPAPLTAERIQAIKSDPLSAKSIHFVLGCTKCDGECKIFCSLEENKEKIVKGYLWYKDLPETFVCKCKATVIRLHFIKENLHTLLGFKANRFSNEEITERTYTIGNLREVIKSFKELIENKKTNEEELQKFIEENPILLSCFMPKLLKFKAPVTRKHKTDFVILNPQDELLLIEIEKPSTRLFKSDGSQHSELTHAINQVEDWLNAGRRNRQALIDDIDMDGLNIDTLTNVRGVVIAGRTLPEESRYMEKIRTRTNILFYTYDDLLKNLIAVTKDYQDL